jgi:hypothetical protein
MKRDVLVLAAVFLAGCITPYQTIETGPRAKVTLTKISTNSPSIPEYKNSTVLSSYVTEADAECKMQFKGRVMIEDEERSRTVFLPAGRVYLVVGLRLPGNFTLMAQWCHSSLNHQKSIRFSTKIRARLRGIWVTSSTS